MTLHDLIQYAFRNVPYYRELLSRLHLHSDDFHNAGDLLNIPVLTKAQVQARTDLFLSDLYSKEDLVVEHTSGSTGIPLTVYKSRDDILRLVRSLWKVRSEVNGIHPNDRFCYFHLFTRSNCGIDTPVVQEHRNRLSFSLMHHDSSYFKIYYQKMCEFEPAWIFAPASTLYLFGRFIQTRGLTIPSSLHYIELNGEYTTDLCKDKIREAFGCSVGNHYGCRELYGIALECCSGKLHCLGDSVIVEIVDANGNPVPQGVEGNICVTGLSNKAMPFIRYLVGDRGVLKHKTCACGNSYPVLDVCAGRAGKYVLIPNREPISPAVFYCGIERINKRYGNCIVQFQVEQKASTEFILRLVLSRNLAEHQDQIIVDFASDMWKLGLKSTKWNVEFVDQIPPNRQTGKLHFFLDNANRIEFAHLG